MGEDHGESLRLGELERLGEGEDRRGVETGHPVEVQDEEEQGGKFRVLGPFGDAIQHGVRRSEEDEPLELEDVDPPAALAKDLPVPGRPLDVARIYGSRQGVPHHVGSAVVDDEQHDGHHQAEGHPLEEAGEPHHEQDHQDDQVVRPGQLEPGVVHPFDQEAEAEEQDHSAEDESREEREHRAAEQKHRPAHGRRQHAHQAAPRPRLVGRGGQAERLESHHAATQARHHVGHPGGPQFPGSGRRPGSP